MLVGRSALGWQGDAGLPKVITLFLAAGALAGVVVSRLTPPEAAHRTESFFLLLRTPIGEEARLRAAGFTELPGSGTFLPPEEAAPAVAAESGRGGVQRQTVYGFAVVTLATLAILMGGVGLAKWLGGNGL
jgi:hypothetical protein